MLPTTIDAIKAILKSDPTITPVDRATMITAIRNHGKTTQPTTQQANRIMHRKEVAERLGLSVRSVDCLAVRGVLKRFVMPGRIRALGFRLNDIEALINGEG